MWFTDVLITFAHYARLYTAGLYQLFLKTWQKIQPIDIDFHTFTREENIKVQWNILLQCIEI